MFRVLQQESVYRIHERGIFNADCFRQDKSLCHHQFRQCKIKQKCVFLARLSTLVLVQNISRPVQNHLCGDNDRGDLNTWRIISPRPFRLPQIPHGL
jgi:hypothetical protein